ncbi:MAG TPA: VOC family protein [Blastocatellia bacterium]|nr:VOC family protein [Blastocatellia bacterium]
MAASRFKVEQIDHVHVHVHDQYEAAAWYKEVLGLEILAGYEDWAADGGPLTISSDGGNTSLALFQRARGSGAAFSTIAFRVGGEAFIAFLAGLKECELRDIRGNRVSSADLVDHERSFSIYFCDPDGNPFELTTYDYQYVSERLAQDSLR